MSVTGEGSLNNKPFTILLLTALLTASPMSTPSSFISSRPGISFAAETGEEPHITGASKIIGGADQRALPAETQGFLEEIEKRGREGQFALGTVYFFGLLGVGRDTAEAARHYRKAADTGHTEAQYNLGLMYEEGEGVPRDLSQAARWHGNAAGQAHAGAQFSLGLLHYRGAGVPKNPSEAADWVLRAAEAGNAGAQFSLGLLYSQGEGVPQDHSEAAKWYSRAAEEGSASPGYGPGLRRYYRPASRRSSQAAVEWFYQAGRSYLERGDHGLASVSLEAIQAISPDDPMGEKLMDQLQVR